MLLLIVREECKGRGESNETEVRESGQRPMLCEDAIQIVAWRREIHQTVHSDRPIAELKDDKLRVHPLQVISWRVSEVLGPGADGSQGIPGKPSDDFPAIIRGPGMGEPWAMAIPVGRILIMFSNNTFPSIAAMICKYKEGPCGIMPAMRYVTQPGMQ